MHIILITFQICQSLPSKCINMDCEEVLVHTIKPLRRNRFILKHIETTVWLQEAIDIQAEGEVVEFEIRSLKILQTIHLS